MDKNEQNREIRHTGRNIWTVVLFLLLCVMLSLILLSPMLSRLTKSDRHIIPLTYHGDREIFEENGFSYIRVDEAPDMLTYDKNVQWQTTTDVDLFKTAYAGSNGEITVNSLTGDKLIAPGTSNEYEFSLKNTGNISLDYTVLFGSVFSLSDRDLPIRVRLRSGDRWILGGKNSWVDHESLSDIIESGTVEVNKYVTYTFEWQWPFESDADGASVPGDLNDTVIAEAAVNEEVTFRLSIETQAEVTPGAVPADGNGTALAEPLTLWNILSRGVFPSALAAGILFLLLIFVRRPILVTGFIPVSLGEEIRIGKKRSEVRPDGRFIFERIYRGKRCFVSGEKECPFKLKYRSKTEGIEFETEDDRLIITVGRKVRAIELYLFPTESGITVSFGNWAAIDKKRNVITPDGVKEPEDRQNTTPGGLHINKDGVYEIPEIPKPEI